MDLFKPDTMILFQDPVVARRLLRSAVVVESGDESFSVRFDGGETELFEGLELVAYFHGRREFMQQIVKVVELIDDADGPLARLLPVGDEASAEYREGRRVSELTVDLFAALGEERQLCVEDVSAEGFAVVSAAAYELGSVLEVSLNFDGDIYSGTASVRSIRELGPDRIRYGLASEPDAGDLIDGLSRISAKMQDEQIK